MYWACAGLGFQYRYWAIFVTMAAEQFGTNLRATAAITATNMVRGALPLTILLFKWLRGFKWLYQRRMADRPLLSLALLWLQLY